MIIIELIPIKIQTVDNNIIGLIKKYFVKVLKIRYEKEKQIEKMKLSKKAKYLEKFKEI